MNSAKNNGETNHAFLNIISAQAKDQILGAIAAHYGVSKDEICDEVIGPEAEHLLDYMVEPARSAARVLMQRHNAL